MTVIKPGNTLQQAWQLAGRRSNNQLGKVNDSLFDFIAMTTDVL
jgi:hypothetical protein